MFNKIIIALGLSCFMSFPLHAEETLLLNTSFATPLVKPNHLGALDVLYRTLGQELGYNIQIELIPAERALINANNGIEDGDACRIANLNTTYPNLIQATEPTMNFKMSAFSKMPKFKLNGIESLKPYHVGYLIGWKILEREITGVKQVTAYATDSELFFALEKNLIDVAIIEKSQGLALLHKDSGIHVLSPPLIMQPCYLYLHKKHAELLPKFDEEMIKMKKDGRYEKIFKDALSPYGIKASDYAP